MGKKVRKKTRGSAKEKGVATHLPIKVIESSNPTVESVDEVAKETNSCPHLVKGVNFDRLSTKIGSSGSVRCEDCREGANDRRRWSETEGDMKESDCQFAMKRERRRRLKCFSFLFLFTKELKKGAHQWVFSFSFPPCLSLID